MEEGFHHVPTITAQKILCCECGILIDPNAANMCVNCIRNRVDITEGIPKQMTTYFCRNCERYLNPPNQWLVCALESRELLAFLLKKVKGLSKVRLIDAGFIWTEPHSKRIKMKLTIQKEAFTSTILQQVFVIEVVVAHQQCADCAKIMAKNTWKSVVQVRQKADHKRTFLYLEQLILKYQAHKDTVNIKEMKDGLDFFFGQKNHAHKFVDFLQSVVPIKYKISEQLISQDTQSGTANYKTTFSVEVVPVCKDDLVCLHPKAASYMGNLSRLCICSKVATTVHFVDPWTVQTSEVPNTVYWRMPFSSLCTSKDLVDFYVLDVESCGTSNGKYLLSDVIVARIADFGKNNITYHCKSHLGHVLKPGDIAMGYDLTNSNFNSEDFDQIKKDLPDIILVKKGYHDKNKKKHRVWRLKTLEKEEEELAPKKQEVHKREEELERFMCDIEEDNELRSTINIYRDDEAIEKRQNVMIEETDRPDVPLEELLDDMKIADSYGGDEEMEQ